MFTVETYSTLGYTRLGVSRTIYVNVDSPNLGFLHFLAAKDEVTARVQRPEGPQRSQFDQFLKKKKNKFSIN